MESYFLVFAVIVTLTCVMCGTSTEEDCFKANSKRFSRIEESLKILENENKNLKNVVEKQQNKISALEGKVQEQERMEKIGNQYINRCK